MTDMFEERHAQALIVSKNDQEMEGPKWQCSMCDVLS